MITKNSFGKTQNGDNVDKYVLDNGVICVHIMNYGATITNIFVKDKDGVSVDVALGYDDVIGYQTHGGYLGAVVGRVANRIKNSQFTLQGKTYKLNSNDGKNNLHGGIKGFDKKIYDCKVDGEKLYMTTFSPDGEENFPGNLHLTVCYYLKGGALNIEYTATCDKTTPISITNHTYFNLSNQDTILNHTLKINSDFITPVANGLATTGEFMNVENTPFDFRKEQEVGLYVDYPHKQLKFASGYDHNYVLKNYGLYEKVATLGCKQTGISMNVYTDNFGMQVYSGNFLNCDGKNGKHYPKRGAICLETQSFPNAVNIPSFPSCLLKEGQTYRKRTTYEFITQNS